MTSFSATREPAPTGDSLFTGTKQVTAGTDEKLTTDNRALAYGVYLHMKASGDIGYIGVEGVSSSTGFVLTYGNQLFIPIQDASKIWVDTADNSDIVTFIAI